MTHTPWRVLGGPLGAHTPPRLHSPAGWARLAVLLVALPVLAALALRGWCLSNGFGGQAPLWRACYSDLPSALVAIGDGDGLGQPVVTEVALRAVAVALPGGAESATGYVLAWALVSLVCVAVLAVAVAVLRSDQPDRALLLVLSPVLALTLLISADIVGVTLAVLGLLAWRRRLDVPAGVLLVLAGFFRSLTLQPLRHTYNLTNPAQHTQHHESQNGKPPISHNLRKRPLPARDEHILPECQALRDALVQSRGLGFETCAFEVGCGCAGKGCVV